MKLIIGENIEKKAKELGLSFDDIYVFIKNSRPNGFKKLCSPISGTTVLKGYINNLDRIIIFNVNQTGILYPVYIGNKKDEIAKNINVSIVRKNAKLWQNLFLNDIKYKKIKIRHF